MTRERLVEIANNFNNQKVEKEDVMDLFSDILIKHKHDASEMPLLVKILNDNGMLGQAMQLSIKELGVDMNLCSVQKKNPKYNPNQTMIINGILSQEEYITLYYY